MRFARAVLLVCACLAAAPAARAADPIKMAGLVQFLRRGSSVDLACGQIASYRSSNTVSGTLVLQLWTSASNNLPPKLTDYKLCEAQVGTLQGHYYIDNVQRTTSFKAPPAGTYYIIFVLSEWNGYSYVPVDWYTFSTPRTFTWYRVIQIGSERIPGT